MATRPKRAPRFLSRESHPKLSFALPTGLNMYSAPFPPYDPTDKSTFAYETVVRRWPIIITGIIDHLYGVNHAIAIAAKAEGSGEADASLAERRITEGKGIIERLSKLKYQMGRDHALEPIADDGEPHVHEYNFELKRLDQEGKGTWFTAPWLFAECYLYRLFRSYFNSTTLWTAYDPFFEQKQATFQQSGDAIYKLATTMHEIGESGLEKDADKLGILFKEMIQICLWGNATDLSLLTNLSPDEIQALQSVQASRKEFILRDDADAVWKHLQTLSDRRVDWALDNSGYELFTDFVFADFLVTHTPYVGKVVFHPKLIPWFVSDVTPPDFAALVSSLSDTSFFPVPPSSAVEDTSQTASAEHLAEMVARWQRYLADGTFVLSVPPATPLGPPRPPHDAEDDVTSTWEAVVGTAGFWSSPWACWHMQEKAQELWEYLKGSALVIFKGDLHYRKLTGDARWPAGTPFGTALGPLAGSFPILSLRTNKADVVVGVDQAVADRLDASEVESERKWRVNGKYALISFLPKSE